MSDAPSAASPDVPAFIARWKASGGSERANYTSFLSELCDVLGVPRPEPTRPDVGQVFMRANTDDVVRLLEMLAAIGKTRTIKGGKYVAS